MAVGEVMRMEIPSGGDMSVTSPELHVLAVDDSIVDRKVIERLLRISACKVTTVESGARALQYLGLDGDKGASGLKYQLLREELDKLKEKERNLTAENKMLLEKYEMGRGGIIPKTTSEDLDTEESEMEVVTDLLIGPPPIRHYKKFHPPN